jgi:protein SCO1/2
MKRTWIGLSLVILCALLFTACGKDAFPVIKKAPAFSMENIDGKQVSLANTKGKVRLVYFYYATCNEICLPTQGIVANVQDELKKQHIFANKTALISISFDPTHDTTTSLQAYAGRLHADTKGWYFLRDADYAKVKALAKKYGIFVAALKGGEFVHTNAITLVDQKGQIRKVYTAKDLVPKNAKNIAADMHTLVQEQN